VHIRRILDEIRLIFRMSYYLLKISLRYPVQFVADFIEISLWIAAFTIAAFLFSSPSSSTSGISPTQFALWGFIIFIVISDVIWSMSTGLRYEQIVGVLEQNFLAPIKEYYYPLARLFRLFIRDLPLFFFIPFVFWLAVGEVVMKNILLAFYILIISTIGSIGFGFFYAGVILKSKRASIISNMLQFFIMIFGATFYPFSSLPKNILIISMIIPFSYYIDAFRITILGIEPELIKVSLNLGMVKITSYQLEIIIIHIITIIFLVIGMKFFESHLKQAKKEGTLHTF